MKKTILMLALLILSIMPFVFAQTGGSPSAPLTTTLSAQDITTFDQILEPVMRIYGFFKYIASVIGVIILVFAGIMYMTSGATPSQLELTLIEGMDNIKGDNRLEALAQEARQAGINYLLQAS